MSWKLITAPDYTATLDLTAVKNFIKVTEATDDVLIQALIATATRTVELQTQLYLFTQTWDYFIDRFRGRLGGHGGQWWNGTRQGHHNQIFGATSVYIKLSRTPLASITEITTFDRDNTETVFDAASYFLDDANKPARVILNDGFSWPTESLREANAYKIRCVLGYGATPADIPDDIEHAILLLVSHWYDNRTTLGGEMTMPEDIKKLLSVHRMFDLG